MSNKRKKFYLPVVVIGICSLLASAAYPQKPMQEPITKAGIFKSLEKKLTADALEHLIKRIQERGVSFELSDSDEDKLRSLQKHLDQKRLNDLIDAIKRNLQPTTSQRSTNATSQGQAPSIAAAAPQREQPTFQEKIEGMSVSLGERGMTYHFFLPDLAKKQPIKTADATTLGYLYVENGKLYFDAQVFFALGEPPIQITHNEISGRPVTWDINSNANAFEIVNERQQPVLQFYYKTPSHIVINGVFVSGNHIHYVSEFGYRTYPAMRIPNLPKQFAAPESFPIKPIFKYPAWKFPGKIVE